VPHPKFGKIVKQMKKFYAHDEQNQAKPGDTVRIMETRPLSKLEAVATRGSRSEVKSDGATSIQTGCS